jgi:hypothetical protein
MTTDYMPQALTLDDIASGNLFPTVSIRHEDIASEPDSTQEVSVSFHEDDHARWQGLVDNGMPEGIAYRTISDGIGRRKDTDTYRLTVIDAPKNLPPHMQPTFGSTYGIGRNWKPRHRVQAADCPEAPAHIINRKLRELPNDRVKWPKNRR